MAMAVGCSSHRALLSPTGLLIAALLGNCGRRALGSGGRRAFGRQLLHLAVGLERLEPGAVLAVGGPSGDMTVIRRVVICA